jgi:hypothetical protein
LSVDAVLIAVIGVCGTLGATWLTQKHADHTKERELDHAERQRRADYEDRAREAALNTRRAAYVALNMQSRQYLTAMRNHVHALKLAPGSTSGMDEVEERRADYRNCYAEAQMIASDAVLATAREANGALNQMYGVLKRLENGTAMEGESAESARALIDGTRELLHELRLLMRSDLGVSEPA